VSAGYHAGFTRVSASQRQQRVEEAEKAEAEAVLKQKHTQKKKKNKNKNVAAKNSPSHNSHYVLIRNHKNCDLF
jgi:hypothetical protein